MTYLRKLNKTYRFFSEKLGGLVLNGYNIVGDGTPVALIPILTGHREHELPNTLKTVPCSDRHFRTVYPFIWKDYKRQGYFTSYAEDDPNLGCFTYRMTGFHRQPTDHYIRPFYLAVDGVKDRSLCVGSKRKSDIYMDQIRHIYAMYPNRPKFVFGFLGEMSHEDVNTVETADEGLYQLLFDLDRTGQLDKTIVVLMSDYGQNLRRSELSLWADRGFAPPPPGGFCKHTSSERALYKKHFKPC